MPSQLDHVTAKILSIAVTCDESDNTVAITDLDFYFSRQKLNAGDGWDIPFSGGAASATACEAELGSVIPPPTIIRIVPTVQA